MAKVDETQVRELARLAHVALPEEELKAVAGQLDRLLGYVAQLGAIDVTGAPETIHVGTRGMRLRADEERPGLPREVVLAMAPSAPAGLFEVPKVLAASEGGLTSATLPEEGA